MFFPVFDSSVSSAASAEVSVLHKAGSELSQSKDQVAEETPVALVYNGISHAVMMTTPTLLSEFAVGFSLSEGIVPSPSDIYSIEITEGCRGGKNIEIQISSECFWQFKKRRRSLVGRSGCGLCGIDSLQEVLRTLPQLPLTQRFSLRHYEAALTSLSQVQLIRRLTGATHAAVWIRPDGTPAGGAEDISRHVALDKLLGLRIIHGWKDGALVISSRASYEMIQKAAACRVEILFAVSAPTHLAIETAEQCGLTLAGFCRSGSLTLYTHPERLQTN